MRECHHMFVRSSERKRYNGYELDRVTVPVVVVVDVTAKSAKRGLQVERIDCRIPELWINP